MDSTAGLRTVAIFEDAKGGIVLAAGLGALELVGRDAQRAAEELVRHFHLNPASHIPRIFPLLVQQATPAHLWALAAGAAGYAGIRFVEAYGLWRRRLWAEWFAIISGGLYVPWEIWELTRGLTWPRVMLLTANLAIVCYLAWILISDRSTTSRPSPTPTC